MSIQLPKPVNHFNPLLICLMWVYPHLLEQSSLLHCTMEFVQKGTSQKCKSVKFQFGRERQFYLKSKKLYVFITCIKNNQDTRQKYYTNMIAMLLTAFNSVFYWHVDGFLGGFFFLEQYMCGQDFFFKNQERKTPVFKNTRVCVDIFQDRVRGSTNVIKCNMKKILPLLWKFLPEAHQILIGRNYIRF